MDLVRLGSVILLLTGVTATAASEKPQAFAADSKKAAARGLSFWSTLAKDCLVPAGETAPGLVAEAVSFLGLPDSRWRDDVGYGVVAACVYRKRALKPDERRALIDRLSANLRRGVGKTGADSVLLRSFSALDLSILAELELDDPALDSVAYRRWIDAALAYLRDERDLRGLEPRVGWIHATAHTADLLKYLARDTRFTAEDQRSLLDAAWAKMTAAGTPVFTHAEDERLAAAIASAVRRADFDAAAFDSWLARFAPLEKQVWSKSPPDPVVLASAQNARNLLRSLLVELSVPGGADATRARDKVVATLAAIRR